MLTSHPYLRIHRQEAPMTHHIPILMTNLYFSFFMRSKQVIEPIQSTLLVEATNEANVLKSCFVEVDVRSMDWKV